LEVPHVSVDNGLKSVELGVCVADLLGSELGSRGQEGGKIIASRPRIDCEQEYWHPTVQLIDIRAAVVRL
jgi:hypothetical protein